MKLLSFKQTPFVTHDGLQRIRIDIGDWDFCNPFRVRCIIGGEVAADFEHFKNYAYFLLPEQEADTVCTVELTPFEDIPVINTVILHPPKHWRIPIVYSSHEDIGYCAYANKLEYQFYEYLKRSLEMCTRNEDFFYTVEHTVWLRSFLYFASPEEKALLDRYVRAGRIELCALPCGVHTSWADGEQLIRSLHDATVDAAEAFGIEPKTAVFADLSGVSWQAVSAYALQGVRYVVVLDNMFRKPTRAGNPPKFFRWEAPNGKESVMCWYPGTAYRDDIYTVWCDTNRQYPEGTFRFDDTHADLTADYFTEKIAAMGDVPHDLCPISFYDDHEFPNSQLLTICRTMNSKWKYPEFTLSTPAAFLTEIEAALGDSLPTLRGEINDQWADFATIAPVWLSNKREAMRRCCDAELLSTLRAAEDWESAYPRREIDGIFRRADLYDEHCWATSSKHPQKMHIFNLAYVKKFSAEHALAQSRALIGAALDTSKGINGYCSLLPYTEKFSMHIPKNAPLPANARTQRLADGSVITEPVEFGALERKLFPEKNAGVAQLTDADAFETDFYRVSLDPRREQIVQIYDKLGGRNLIDEAAPYPIGTFLYARNETKEDPNLAIETPKRRGMTVEAGDVAYVVTIRGYEEQSGADTSAVFRFSRFDRAIDIDLRYTDAVSMLGDYADRYKKNIFYSFPFAANKPYTFLTQLPGGKAYSVEEKMPVCPLDYSVAEHWVALDEKTKGVALYSADAPVFHFGEIQYNRFSLDNTRTLSHPHIYLYAASNRTNNLNLRTPEDCTAVFRLSVLPYEGEWQDSVPEWDKRMSHAPVCAHVDGEGSFGFSVDEKLRLMACRPTKDGGAVEVRFAEDCGKARERVSLTVPFKVNAAWYTSLNGKRIGAAETSGNTVIFDIGAYSYATLEISGEVKFKKQPDALDEICNAVMIPIENTRSIVCFEKTKLCKAETFRVISGGRVLAEAANDIYRVQCIELDCRPENFTVEAI